MSAAHQIEKLLELQREAMLLDAEGKRSLTRFLLQEVSLGLTFLHLAHASEQRGRAASANRQKAAAKAALETILKFLPKAELNQKQKADIEAGIEELDSKLEVLVDSF